MTSKGDGGVQYSYGKNERFFRGYAVDYHIQKKCHILQPGTNVLSVKYMEMCKSLRPDVSSTHGGASRKR